jgi:gamma-glutamyl:cysteine ligase YbdK (ATP-grasp superfamily)
MSWQHDKRRPKKPIAFTDLMAALTQVMGRDTIYKVRGTYKRNGKQRNRWREIRIGLSITRLAKALNCHRAKATRLLAILRELQLIAKTANYSAGRSGNCYAILRVGQTPPPPPAPMPRPDSSPVRAAQPGHMDDPF